MKDKAPRRWWRCAVRAEGGDGIRGDFLTACRAWPSRTYARRCRDAIQVVPAPASFPAIAKRAWPAAERCFRWMSGPLRTGASAFSRARWF